MNKRSGEARRAVLSAVRSVVLSVIVGVVAVSAVSAVSDVRSADAMTLDRPGTEVRASSGGYWTGYWTWNKKQQKWVWTWVWVSSGSGVKAS